MRIMSNEELRQALQDAYSTGVIWESFRKSENPELHVPNFEEWYEAFYG